MTDVPTASIIIPTWNQLPYTRMCLQSLRRHTPVSHEVIVVDNGSSDGTVAHLSQQPDVRLFQNGVNRGFAAAANRGIRAARGRVLVLLNNDTLPSHRWLEQLIAVLEADRRNGLVGPLSNRVIPEQKIRVRLSSPGQVHAFSNRFNRSDPAKWRITPRLSGFCLAFPARLVEVIGYLDEGFRVGTYEDDDYCYRARRAGYRCIVAGDTYVHHFGNRSFRRRGREAFRRILARNRQYFTSKWGKTPEKARMEKLN